LKRRFDGVIFDMDGTLIESNLDFAAIRATLGIPDGVGIIEAMEQMPAQRRREAEDWLERQELAAARGAAPVPGAVEIVMAIRRAGLKTALLTRNARGAMEVVLERLAVAFDLAWSREEGPIKPDPDGVLRACRAMGISPHRTACVGDFEYDIVAANAAGAVSVLLVLGQRPTFANCADHVITELDQLRSILEL